MILDKPLNLALVCLALEMLHPVLVSALPDGH